MKLNLGCGRKGKKEGYINIDIDPAVEPDVVCDVTKLNMYGKKSVDVIECYHLVEHLTLLQAREAFSQWSDILKPEGKLIMELPNINRCMILLHNESCGDIHPDLYDSGGYNLAMVGIYGWPPMINADPITQQHKWGWTPRTLKNELTDFGFYNIVITGEVEQKWRKAYHIKRDMRVIAIKRP